MAITKVSSESEILNKAVAAAKAATNDYINQHLQNMDCYPFGFAWVVIKPARGKFVNFLKKNNIGHKQYGGGYSIWNPANTMFQNVDCEYAGAVAFARVLSEHDINCFAKSRLD